MLGVNLRKEVQLSSTSAKKKVDVHTRSFFFEIWVGFISEMASDI